MLKAGMKRRPAQSAPSLPMRSLDPTHGPGRVAQMAYREQLLVSRLRRGRAVLRLQRAFRRLQVRREAQRARWLALQRPPPEPSSLGPRLAEYSLLKDLGVGGPNELPPELGAAAIAFDARRAQLASLAEALLTSAQESGGASVVILQQLQRAHAEVRRHKLCVHETYDPYPPPIVPKPKKWKPRKKWRLGESIWKVGNRKECIVRGGSDLSGSTLSSLPTLEACDFILPHLLHPYSLLPLSFSSCALHYAPLAERSLCARKCALCVCVCFCACACACVRVRARVRVRVRARVHARPCGYATTHCVAGAKSSW